jgi:hypothetical protein
MLWRCPREQGTYPHVRHIFLGGNTWYPKFYPWTYSNPASREYIYLPPMQKKKNYLNPDILMCLDNLKSTFNTMMISFSAWRDHLNSPILMSRVPNFHHKRIFSARCKRRPAPCLLDFGRTGPGYQPGFVWLFLGKPPKASHGESSVSYDICHLGSIPSGKRLHNHGKSPRYSWENSLFLWPFSIANC